MKLGINTFLFCSPLANKHLGLLKTFADWGFDCAEIAVEDPELVDGASVAAAFQESGLSHLITCGAYGPGRDLRGTKQEQQAALDYTRQVMDMMPAYGSTLFCGPLYSAVGRAKGYSADEKARHWDLVAENLSVLSRHAQSLDITIGMEVLNRFETDFMNTAAQAVVMVETVNHPALKIHLDSFHMNIEEQSFGGAIRTAGKHLAHFHASANHRGTPGLDTIPWTEIRDALIEIEYAGDLVIESFSTEIETIARACCIWRNPGDAESIAKDGLRFLKSL